MRSLKSAFAIGGLVCALLAVGVATSAASVSTRSSGAVREIAIVAQAPVAAPVAVVETDADRRERLNARLQDMIRSGKGGRLSEPRAIRASSRASSSRAPSRRAATPTPSTPAATQLQSVVSTPARTETSTIAPPAYGGRGIQTSGGRYQPPRLNLSTAPVVPTNDLECLTQAIYYEARNESEEGQAAVAEVVINRSRARGYPQKICQVVYQRNSRTCQFTFTCDGAIGRSPVNMTAWTRAERIARDVYEGRSKSLLPRNSVNYHANYVRPSWGRRLERVRQIGAHIFYGASLNGQGTPGADAPRSDPAPTGLVFARIEALDRAYAALTAAAAPAATN